MQNNLFHPILTVSSLARNWAFGLFWAGVLFSSLPLQSWDRILLYSASVRKPRGRWGLDSPWQGRSVINAAIWVWAQVTDVALHLPQVAATRSALLIRAGQNRKCKTEWTRRRHTKCSHRGRGAQMALERPRECRYGASLPLVSSLVPGNGVEKETVYFFILCAHMQYTYIFISQFKKPKSWVSNEILVF